MALHGRTRHLAFFSSALRHPRFLPKSLLPLLTACRETAEILAVLWNPEAVCSGEPSAPRAEGRRQDSRTKLLLIAGAPSDRAVPTRAHTHCSQSLPQTAQPRARTAERALLIVTYQYS